MPYFSTEAATTAAALFLGSLLWVKRSVTMKSNMDRFTGAGIKFEICAGKRIEGKRTVILTGGNGFVGRFITQFLVEKGLNVVVFDVMLPEASKRHENVTYIRGNLLDVNHIEKVFLSLDPYGVDSVIHVASLIPFLGVPESAIWAVNVQGTKNLIDIASKHGVRGFIYTSSATVVLEWANRNAAKLDEDTPLPKKNLDTYTSTKVAAEKIVREASSLKEGGLVSCVLRPAAIFGKGDKLISDKHVKGEDSVVIGTGSAKLDWVPVECVAMAHVLAEEALSTDEGRKRLHANVYNIGNNEERGYGWFNGLGTKGRTSTGDDDTSLSHWNQKHPQCLPLWLAYSLSYINLFAYNLTGTPVLEASLAPSLLDFTQRNYTFKSDKAQRDFGYKPLYTVEQAIHRLVDNHVAGK